MLKWKRFTSKNAQISRSDFKKIYLAKVDEYEADQPE